MRWLIILLLIVGCQPVPPQENVTIDYGDVVNFTFLETNITANGSLTVLFSNTTEELFTYEYCDIPFAVLEEHENHWRYIYPDIIECGTPQNKTFIPNRTVSISDIRLKEGKTIDPGRYMFKIYYSTYAPATYMREFKQIVEIR